MALSPKDRNKARARLKRRAFPIHFYAGPNGSGKSWTAVYDTLPTLDFGRPVLSTLRFLDYRNPRECDGDFCDDEAGHVTASGVIHQAAHPLYVPFTDYQQLLDWRDGDVVMDEVLGIASSRESDSLPVQVTNVLHQLRRRNVCLRLTGVAFGRADKIIREATQAVTICQGYFPKRRPTPAGSPPRLWSDNQAFHAVTFDSALLDAFDHKAAEDIPSMANAYYWRPGSLAQTAYDTLDVVTALGWANEAGLCMACGGKRRHPVCACETGPRVKRGKPGPAAASAEREPQGPDPSATGPVLIALASEAPAA